MCRFDARRAPGVRFKCTSLGRHSGDDQGEDAVIAALLQTEIDSERHAEKTLKELGADRRPEVAESNTSQATRPKTACPPRAPDPAPRCSYAVTFASTSYIRVILPAT